MRGAADVQVETLTGKPVLTLQVDRAAARFGLSVTEVLEVVQAGLGGEAVSTLIDGTRRYEIVVRFAEGARSTIEDILRIPLRTAEGDLVPLSPLTIVSILVLLLHGLQLPAARAPRISGVPFLGHRRRLRAPARGGGRALHLDAVDPLHPPRGLPYARAAARAQGRGAFGGGGACVRSRLRPRQPGRGRDPGPRGQGITNITVIDVRAVWAGHEHAPQEVHDSLQLAERYMSVARLETLVVDEDAPLVIEVIRKAAHTGRPGDGVVYAVPAEDVVHVRTGRRDRNALIHGG